MFPAFGTAIFQPHPNRASRCVSARPSRTLVVSFDNTALGVGRYGCKKRWNASNCQHVQNTSDPIPFTGTRTSAIMDGSGSQDLTTDETNLLLTSPRSCQRSQQRGTSSSCRSAWLLDLGCRSDTHKMSSRLPSRQTVKYLYPDAMKRQLHTATRCIVSHNVDCPVWQI